MPTAAHPETDGQAERVNRVLEDVLRSYATSFTSWRKFLPLAEFALNNAEHASTGLTPFFANNARHPRVPALLAVAHPTVPGASTLVGDDDGDHDEDNGVGDVVTSGDHDPEALHAIIRSKSKRALAAPSSAASPLAAWTARTLIDPVNTGTPIAANYTPKSLQRRRRSSAPATPDLTGAPLQAPFSPVRPEPSPPQPPPERLEHDSSQLRHPPGSSRCARNRREPPPPIVDSAGQTCWIVDHLVAHEDPPRATSRTRARTSPPSTRGIPPARRNRVRWLGYPPDEDTWEPRSVLLRDVPDVVFEYENGTSNESAAAAVPAATKTATENANGHVATGVDPVVNEHGGLRRE
ncbi:unnamed protein product [Phytophthora fragariaefolia]|uniref:Unnamed protein product n=1 Tax=Phytophthora fragariaefolia TaxID=1490495 RepID=A0A9W7D5E7_9STRA|nr:unnamed protein product [Phytophthora fragariaefolia]